MRDQAILEVLTFEKSANFLRDDLTRSFAVSRRNKNSFMRIVPGSDDSVSAKERAVISLRTFVQTVQFSTIAWLVVCGIDPSKLPGHADGTAMNYANFNRNAALESKRLDQLLGKKQTFDANTGIATQEAVMTEEQHKRLSQVLLAWQAKCGLAGPSAPEECQPWHEFINAVAGLSLRPLLLDQKMHDYFSMHRLFNADAVRGAVVRSTRLGELSTPYDLRNSQLGALLYVQSSAAKGLFATMGEAAERVLSRQVGISLSTTERGGNGDTYL